MPWARHCQVAPPSRVDQTPPQDTATAIRSPSRGSTQMEWIPGASVPPPNQARRSGWSHRLRTRLQEPPRSAERNRPPGMVPAQSRPGWLARPGSRAQIRCSFQGISRPMGSRSTWPAGGSG